MAFAIASSLMLAAPLANTLAAAPPASAATAAGASSTPAGQAALLSRLPAELRPLVQELLRYGFQLRLAPPPARGAYGQFVPQSRTIWLAPIAWELGIGRQTLLHEAVHAVQSCPDGRLTPIGWRFRLEPVVEREINGILHTRYHPNHRLLEREAFGLQGQPDAVPRLIAALRSRCRRTS